MMIFCLFQRQQRREDSKLSCARENWVAALCYLIVVFGCLGTAASVQAQGFEWSSYIGGPTFFEPFTGGIAVDEEGSVYVSGTTWSSGWVSGGFDTSFSGPVDGFVVKLDANGAHLWSTYLDSAGNPNAGDMVIDPSGDVIIAGSPIVRLSSSGGLVWSAPVVGPKLSIAMDAIGNIFAAGFSNDQGTLNGGADPTNNGHIDGTLTKLSNAGVVQWATYIGGSGPEEAHDVAIDGDDNVIVVGNTASSGWTVNGSDLSYGEGSQDGFVAKFSNDGPLIWSRYVGGSGFDHATGVITDTSKNIYVTGQTNSPGWVSGGYDTSLEGHDGYVIKMTSESLTIWSTYLGAAGDDGALEPELDIWDNLYVCGRTASSSWISGGFDTSFNGGTDAFVMKLTNAGIPIWSTVLGGSSTEYASRMTVGSGKIYIMGVTQSSNWTQGGYDTSFAGTHDFFVAKLSSIGSIRVDLYPPDAVDDGAQWSANGGISYHNSGASAQANIGERTISFLPLTHWDAPQSQLVAVYEDDLTTATGTYIRKMGALQVAIDPAEAVIGGAQWSIDAGAQWHDHLTSLTLPTNDYSLSFSPIADWDPPSTRTIAVSKDMLTSTTATYTRQVGSLAVTLEPSAAVSAGARWRRTGTVLWLESGETESSIPTDLYLVEFATAAGWIAPEPKQVVIQKNMTASPTWEYIRSPLDATSVWVDFSFAGEEWGSESNPYGTLEHGVAAVASGGTIRIKNGTSAETMRIGKPMRWLAPSGAVRIGQ